MKKRSAIRRVALCVSVLAIALSVPMSRAADPAPPLRLDVTVTNTPLPVTGTVTIGNSPRPSQLVTLETTVGPGNCPNRVDILVDALLNPDATRSLFSIPPGKVLVITDALADILREFGAAGHGATFRLLRATTAGENLIALQTGTINSAGGISAVFNFPTGVVVKSGVALCLSALDETTDQTVTAHLTVHGYLTTDQ